MRQKLAEPRDSIRKGEEKINISSANLYMELKLQLDKESECGQVTHDEGKKVGPAVPQKEPGMTYYDPETR